MRALLYWKERKYYPCKLENMSGSSAAWTEYVYITACMNEAGIE